MIYLYTFLTILRLYILIFLKSSDFYNHIWCADFGEDIHKNIYIMNDNNSGLMKYSIKNNPFKNWSSLSVYIQGIKIKVLRYGLQYWKTLLFALLRNQMYLSWIHYTRLTLRELYNKEATYFDPLQYTWQITACMADTLHWIYPLIE